MSRSLRPRAGRPGFRAESHVDPIWCIFGLDAGHMPRQAAAMQIGNRPATGTGRWGWLYVCALGGAACGHDAVSNPPEDAIAAEIHGDDAGHVDSDAGGLPDGAADAAPEDVHTTDTTPDDATPPARRFAFTPSEPVAAATSPRFRVRAAFTSQPASASPPASPRFRLRP